MLCDCCRQRDTEKIVIQEPWSDTKDEEAQPFGLCLYCFEDHREWLDSHAL